MVHRSQKDPLAADETAPQRVLVPVNANVPGRKEKGPVSLFCESCLLHLLTILLLFLRSLYSSDYYYSNLYSLF